MNNFSLKPWGRWAIIISGWAFLMWAFVVTRNDQILTFLIATVAMGIGYMFKARTDEKKQKGEE